MIVCTHNGARTLRRCLEGIAGLRYPRYEVIVVDDGSTDGSAAIAAEFDVRADLDREERAQRGAQRRPGRRPRRNRRVPRRRRLARPRLAALSRSRLPHRRATRPSAGRTSPRRTMRSVAACVANSPGGPTHVLLSDSEAEHIPGCNMAYRRQTLERDRRLRSAVPRRRRRRRRLLAAAGRRRDPGFPRGRRRLAPPPRLRAGLLAAAGRLRPRRGAARAEVARALQPARPSDLGRAPVRPRQQASAAAGSHLPRRLGHGRLPAGGGAAEDR